MAEDARCADSLLVTPVTALEFVEHLLLTGEGPNLKVYNVSGADKSLVTSVRLFKATNIHGITVGPRVSNGSYLVSVHGAKSCCVVTLDTEKVSVRLRCLEEFSDWILAVTWLTKNDNQLALVTAHNCVVRWDWTNGAILKTVHCKEKCILFSQFLDILNQRRHFPKSWNWRLAFQGGQLSLGPIIQELLYSALLIGDCWCHLVAAGGTVFNQVVLWSVTDVHECVTDGPDEAVRRRVLHRLAGHQGVIFSMTFNPTTRQLCSVSDDRSIRVWKVDAKDDTPSTDQPHTHAHPHHLLNNPPIHWERASFYLLHVLYGHTARVWDARYLGDLLVSVGEDSTCCVWNADGRVVKKFKGHRGKSIWSLAVREQSPLIATGGGDTGIRLWELGDGGTGEDNLSLSQLTPPPHLLEDGAAFQPKVAQLVNKDTVIVMTDAGRLYRYRADTDEWSLMLTDESFRSYSIMAVSPGGARLTIGNISGHIRLLMEGGSSDTACYSGKVFSMMWLSDNILLTTGPDGQIVLWEVGDNIPGLPCLHKLHVLTLPPARQRWVAAAALLPDQDLLVCGDRVGSVHVYDLSQQGIEDPVQSFWKVHGKAGVTNVCYHDDHVYSAGRDGEYRQYDVTQRRLQLLHSNKVLKGLEWIAQIRFTTDDDMHVLGFFTDQFIVHSVGTNQTVLSLPCGGGHRAWDFTLEESSGHVSFVYIKAGRVEMCRTQLRSHHTVLKPSLHGREVTDAKLISAVATPDGVSSVIATSSEDTRINIISLQSSHNSAPKYSILATLQGHISSIRILATSASQRSNACTYAQGQSTTSNNLEDKGQIQGHKPQGRQLEMQCQGQKRQCQGEEGQGRGQNTNCDVHENSHVLLFSGGGRAQLKAWRITTSATQRSERSTPKMQRSNTNDLCEPCDSSKQIEDKFACGDNVKDSETSDEVGVQYEHLATYNLHEKGRRNRKPWRNATFDPCPETRYMALSALPLTEALLTGDASLHILAAACSDGFVRLMCFHEDERRFHVFAHSDHHNHCVLSIRLFTIQYPNHPRLYLCSAGTDGSVLFWDVTELVKHYTECVRKQCCHHVEAVGTAVEPCLTETTLDLPNPELVVKAHKSGVNALDLYPVNDTELLLVSGGDDNCLSVHRLAFTETETGSTLTVVASEKHATAHAAQVNGIHIQNEHTVQSVSIDQRLITWNLSHDLKLTQTCCRFVHVSDVSHMETWRAGDMLHTVITGTGLEYLVS